MLTQPERQHNLKARPEKQQEMHMHTDSWIAIPKPSKTGQFGLNMPQPGQAEDKRIRSINAFSDLPYLLYVSTHLSDACLHRTHTHTQKIR